jgi:DNA-binding response OmpR family regulator
MAKILVVEDDKVLCEHIRSCLVFEANTVETANDGGEAWEFLRAYTFDVVVLDWDLPTISGLDLCKKLRASGVTSPVLMLTGKAGLQDKEAGLDSGADDYLTKPFHFKELSARLRALLRRPTSFVSEKIVVGDIALDTLKHRVLRDDVEVHLQPREFALLEFLMRHPNQIYGSKALLDAVWSSDSDVTEDIVRVYVKNIRRKISVEGKPCIIKTVHGLGYKVEA